MPRVQKETVSRSTGRIADRLLYTVGCTLYGIMLAELLSDTRLRVEVFEGSEASATDFDTRAQVYVR